MPIDAAFMLIRAAYATIEAASLPVEAMDHLEHSTYQIKQFDDFVYNDMNIALCSGICISVLLWKYVRECVWKCGVMVVIHELAYIECTFGIFNICNSLKSGLECELYYVLNTYSPRALIASHLHPP